MTVQKPPGAVIDILLLDENQIFADVLAMRLRDEAGVRTVAVASSVAEAMARLNASDADLLIVDYGVRGELVLPMMTELSWLPVTPSVLVLSAVRDSQAVVTALQSGVRGWVTKDSPFATVWNAAREIMKGNMVLSPAVTAPVAERLLVALRQEEPAPQRHDFVAELSAREYEVLQCLVAGMNRKEIAERLFLSINTVRTHVRHLLQRADEHTTLALVAAARDLKVTAIDYSL